MSDFTLHKYDKIDQLHWLVEEICEVCKKAYMLHWNRLYRWDDIKLQKKILPLRKLLLKKRNINFCAWWMGSLIVYITFSFIMVRWIWRMTWKQFQMSTMEIPYTLYHMVVINLLGGLSNVGHVVVINNYFIWIGLFKRFVGVVCKRFWCNDSIVWNYERL